MKKGKMLRNASLVALSAVLVAGSAAAFAGCANNADTLSVYIFCGAADAYTNQRICDEWAAKYSQQIGREISVKLTPNGSKDDYIDDIQKKFSNGTAEDVVYMSPKFTKVWAEVGYVMDLSEYIFEDTEVDPKADTVSALQDVWQNGLSYYGYQKGKANEYTLGQPVTLNATQDGFVTENGNEKVGMYALPKDYSNFAMGYNKKFFTEDLKIAYQTHKGSEKRSVQAGCQKNNYTTKGLTYTGSGSTPVATYAVNTEARNVGGVQIPAGTQDGEAPLINIGIPTAYHTFNFYKYNDYDTAFAAGDPIALLCDQYTDGEGYIVTIPGFPGETFEVDEKYRDDAAPYDTSVGHITYTYAEFGALSWAMTYYLNTFGWEGSTVTSGQGGIDTTVGRSNIYANDMYENAQGMPLYLLTWLAANDADFIDKSVTKVINGTEPDRTSSAKSSQQAHTEADATVKKNLDGSTRTVDVQYGINSKNFFETYAAYTLYGSAFNGNAGFTGDTTDSKPSGWEFFRLGSNIFYGAGTWDAATRNDSDHSYFEFGEMPAPVAEKYALYTKTLNEDYEQVTYSNGATDKATGDAVKDEGVQRSNKEDGLKVYNQDEIEANQLIRQDKWAARMDSIGYAANGRLLNYEGTDQEWKIKGAASLIMALTLRKDPQTLLTYGGAQLPNFSTQCKDFLDYNKAGHENGSFKDMLTPEGFATTTDPAEGREIWERYYDVAEELGDASKDVSKANMTVGEFLSDKNVVYDESYRDYKLGDFPQSETGYAFAMRILRMVAFDRVDRDLNIRMQYGLNSVRDSSMYTYNNVWIGSIDPSAQGKLLSYVKGARLEANGNPMGNKTFADTIAFSASEAESKTLQTPATYLVRMAKAVQDSLQEAINLENNILSAAG